MGDSTGLTDAAVKSVQADAAAMQNAAAQVQTAARADAIRVQGWLRRNIWGVVGVAVILALILVAVLAR